MIGTRIAAAADERLGTDVVRAVRALPVGGAVRGLMAGVGRSGVGPGAGW
ncbi:hypothetical protein [Streptomyces sp. NPDC047071]